MGEPVKIVDLAKDLIRLSGFRPDDDIEIVFSGIRIGEKLFEELSTGRENADKTKHPKIFVGKIAPQPWAEVSAHVDSMLKMVDAPDPVAIRTALVGLVPEYTPTQVAATAVAASTARTSRRSGPSEVLALSTVQH
jgi:FlaA1/EpsC-like NDP-sugar epimerase